ncbi:MAG: DUF624 domain-containing protein [Ruminococcaceae bacterium]|nr:DUF624 domain-containing protein [Oscillospiraceae bacterium]
MSKLTESSLAELLRSFGDLILLNVLCIVCCIPIVTIGASVSAMYSVIFKLNRDENCPVIRTFFKFFKENFLQALALEGGFLFFGFVAYFYITYALGFEGNARTVFLIIGTVIACLSLLIFTLGLAQVANFKNKLKNIIKNSFLLAFCCPFWVVLIWAVWLVQVVLAIYVPFNIIVNFGFIVMLCGMSLPAFITVKILESKVFSKFASAPAAESAAAIEEQSEDVVSETAEPIFADEERANDAEENPSDTEEVAYDDEANE